MGVEVQVRGVLGEQREPRVVDGQDGPPERVLVDVADLEVLEEPALPPGLIISPAYAAGHERLRAAGERDRPARQDRRRHRLRRRRVRARAGRGRSGRDRHRGLRGRRRPRPREGPRPPLRARRRGAAPARGRVGRRRDADAQPAPRARTRAARSRSSRASCASTCGSPSRCPRASSSSCCGPVDDETEVRAARPARDRRAGRLRPRRDDRVRRHAPDRDRSRRCATACWPPTRRAPSASPSSRPTCASASRPATTSCRCARTCCAYQPVKTSSPVRSSARASIRAVGELGGDRVLLAREQAVDDPPVAVARAAGSGRRSRPARASPRRFEQRRRRSRRSTCARSGSQPREPARGARCRRRTAARSCAPPATPAANSCAAASTDLAVPALDQDDRRLREHHRRRRSDRRDVLVLEPLARLGRREPAAEQRADDRIGDVRAARRRPRSAPRRSRPCPGLKSLIHDSSYGRWAPVRPNRRPSRYLRRGG